MVDEKLKQSTQVDGVSSIRFEIGVGDYKYHILAAIIAKDAKAIENWQTLARNLGLEAVDLYNLKRHDQNETNKNELFCQMLTSWKSNKGYNATFDALKEALQISGLTDCKNKLENHFPSNK